MQNALNPGNTKVPVRQRYLPTPVIRQDNHQRLESLFGNRANGKRAQKHKLMFRPLKIAQHAASTDVFLSVTGIDGGERT